MSILKFSNSELNKIAKKASLSVEELKSISELLIRETHESIQQAKKSSKMHNQTTFYTIRLKSRVTQLSLNNRLSPKE